MAEKYFKHYPTIDFDVKNDGELIEAKDIFLEMSGVSLLQK